MLIYTVGWSLSDTDPVCRPGLRDSEVRENTHAAARSLLSEQGQTLEHDPSGRPMAVSELSGAAPGISLSYAGGGGAVAIAPFLAIGIDLEPVQLLDDVERLAATTCNPAEYRAVVDSAEPETSFLRCWTRKEAAFKAGPDQPRDPRSVVVGTGGSGWELTAPGSLGCQLYLRTLMLGKPGRLAVLSVAAVRPFAVGFRCFRSSAGPLMSEFVNLSPAPMDFGRWS